MAHATVNDLRGRANKAWAQLRAQLQGMEPYLDKSDAPGQWTTREVLSHLLFEPGWKPVALLKQSTNLLEYAFPGRDVQVEQNVCR